MTSSRLLAGALLALAVSCATPLPVLAADTAPPQSAPADQPPPAPAAVFVRPLDEQGHGAAAAKAAPEPAGPTIDSVLSTMRKLGAITLSALAMLIGSALAGILIAGTVLLVRKRREQRSAS